MENGFVFAGVNAFKSKKIVSVKEMIKSLLEEYTMAASHQTAPI